MRRPVDVKHFFFGRCFLHTLQAASSTRRRKARLGSSFRKPPFPLISVHSLDSLSLRHNWGRPSVGRRRILPVCTCRPAADLRTRATLFYAVLPCSRCFHS